VKEGGRERGIEGESEEFYVLHQAVDGMALAGAAVIVGGWGG